MKKYIFITNSIKPTSEKAESLENIVLDNVSEPCIKKALSLGYDVYLGVNRANPEKLKCNEYPIKFYDSHTYRNIFAIKDNLIAYKNLCKLLRSGDVDVIHCNTPIGGLIGRICGKKYRVRKIIYTVHGFHFYKGAPLLNNTVFKCIEKIMARWTDVIITINSEDFHSAKKFRLKEGGNVYQIHGVGIDTAAFSNFVLNKNEYRKTLNLDDQDFVCIVTGRLDKNKNIDVCLKAISKCSNSRIHFLICGEGGERDSLKRLAQNLNIENQIHFLGYRKDIKELLAIADCFLFSSKREGLSRSIMEAMASGLPCIVSDIKGNVDLIENSKGGYLIKNEDDYSIKINELYLDREKCKIMGSYNKIKVKGFDQETVYKEISDIYNLELM